MSNKNIYRDGNLMSSVKLDYSQLKTDPDLKRFANNNSFKEPNSTNVKKLN